MALRVWLPLNKDFRNQGLDDITVTTASTSIKTDGPVGGCCEFTNTKRLTFPSQEWMRPTNEQSFSIAMFVRATTFNYIIAAGAFEIRLIASTAQFRTGDGSGGYTCNAQDNVAKTEGVWYHLTGVWDSLARKVSLYVDGNLAASANSTVSTFKAISSTINVVYGGQFDICDLRMYDHALSAKEVKEISKGLVQHFKLDETYGMTNLFAGKTFNVYNNYGTGMTCVQEDTGETYMGQPVRRFTYTIVNSSCASGFKSGYSSRGVYVGQCYFGASGTSIPFVYWIYYRPQTSGLTAGGTASNIGGWSLIPSEYVGDGWYRVGQYRTGNSSTARTSDNVFTSLNWPYAGIGSSCTMDFTVAGYLISGTTEIPENFVEGNSVVHDCSGFGNDGTVYGTLKHINDSAKYCGSTYIGANNAVVAGRGGMVRYAITVAIWAYMSSWSSYNGRLASCTEGGGWNFEPSSSKMNFAMGTGVSSNTYKSALSTRTLASLGSGWHHFVGTYDGFTTKIYIDGVLEGTNAAYTEHTPIYYANNAVFVGAEAAGSQVNPTGSYFNGNLSDFRIYGTALSAEDILELYHTSASIDNHGNFYCGELKEL